MTSPLRHLACWTIYKAPVTYYFERLSYLESANTRSTPFPSAKRDRHNEGPTWRFIDELRVA